jgi:hypothetical protein
MWELFHSLWGSDKRSPSYRKAKWMRLQQLLEREHNRAEDSPETIL